MGEAVASGGVVLVFDTMWFSSTQFSSACVPGPAEQSPEGQAGHNCTACVEDYAYGVGFSVGSRLERSYAILRHIGGHLGASEALLEPSWATLDAPTSRETPRPGPGEGVGGGVKLLPWRKPSRSFPPALPTRK